MKIRVFALMAALLLLGSSVLSLVACADKDPVVETAPDTVAETETETQPEIETETETEVETEPPYDWKPTNADASKLNDLMLSIFSGNTVREETVMFIDKGDVKDLLYPIKEVKSVTSYDGTITYTAGVDYEVVDGKLKVPANSSINCITSEVYYNYNDSALTGVLLTQNGKNIFWGEGKIQNYQIRVTYTHESTWSGYAQESQLQVFDSFVKKLDAGEDVTVVFYGDSITHGASASWLTGSAPYQYPYSILFTQALADLFGYTVHYVDDYSKQSSVSLLEGAPIVPAEDYVAGERGTITYINTAVGGWDSLTAAQQAQKYLYEPIARYGCDLVVLALGMNDGDSNISNIILQMINGVHSVDPDAVAAVVSTMMPHPKTNWDGAQKNQEKYLLNMAEQAREKGKNVAVVCMNSVSKDILKTKTFNDCTGNNINHPNDFFCRVYAQTLLQAIIGYENLE